VAISSNVSNSLAIGIEIGGTKIQVGIGSTSGKLVQLPIRKQPIQGNGTEGIRRDLISWWQMR
jgi:predicted NBD/HSP70 family sugar kinase